MIANRVALLIFLWSTVGRTFQHRREFCHDVGRNYKAKVFHLHTPKVAGCSVVEDLSDMIGRENIFSREQCFNTSNEEGFKSLQDRVVFVRQPREHVYSQYEFCKLATDPGYRENVAKNQGLPGQKNYHLASSFQKWIQEWTEKPRYGRNTLYSDYEQCYCPHNLQTTRLACTDNSYICVPTADMDFAQQSLKAATMVGVTEAYHESICLFHAHLLGTLPDYCHCGTSAWKQYHETKDVHGIHYDRSIEDEAAEVIEQVDAMTKQDKVIYQMAVKRFIEDVQKMERRFDTKILCPDAMTTLDQKANY